MTRAIERLRADEGLRREGVALVIDALLRKRVHELVEIGGLTTLFVELLSAANAERAIERHLEPMWARHRARSVDVGERVGDSLPSDVRAELEELVMEMPLPRLDWAARRVDLKLVRALFAPVLSGWLVEFVKKTPVLGGGVGGLAGALKNVGGARRVLGGMDERMRSVADRFTESAMSELRRAVLTRLTSDEGVRLVAELRKQIFDSITEAEVAEVMDDLDRLPRVALLALGPRVVEHNARRVFGQRLLREEIAAFVSALGERTLHELLEEAGALPDIRAYLRSVGEEIATELCADPRFAEWLRRLGS